MKKSNSSNTFKKKPKVRRSGVHAKTKHSNHKKARNYKKLNRGQG